MLNYLNISWKEKKWMTIKDSNGGPKPYNIHSLNFSKKCVQHFQPLDTGRDVSEKKYSRFHRQLWKSPHSCLDFHHHKYHEVIRCLHLCLETLTVKVMKTNLLVWTILTLATSWTQLQSRWNVTPGAEGLLNFKWMFKSYLSLCNYFRITLTKLHDMATED